jgi:hypothetical protein
MGWVQGIASTVADDALKIARGADKEDKAAA